MLVIKGYQKSKNNINYDIDPNFIGDGKIILMMEGYYK